MVNKIYSVAHTFELGANPSIIDYESIIEDEYNKGSNHGTQYEEP